MKGKSMSIPDVIEEKIFRTLGKAKAPAFKPAETLRPTEKPVPVEYTPSPEVDEFTQKLIDEMDELNESINGLQKMIKWYLITLFLAVIALMLTLIFRF